MDIYRWMRARKEPSVQPRDGWPEPRKATAVTVNWQGAPTPLFIEPLRLGYSTYFAFRPVGAPAARAFVVGRDAAQGDDFGNRNPRADAFGFRDEGALRVFDPHQGRNYGGVAELVENIESGRYGLLDFEPGEPRDYGVWRNFYGATGRLTRDFQDDMVIMGMMIEPRLYQLSDPKYDPELRVVPWCDAAEAPALLQKLDGAQLAAWVGEQQTDPTTAAGFARAWKSWSHKERLGWLSPLEREIEAEVCRLMKWVYWSAPQMRWPKDFPTRTRRPQWFRPRFVVQPDDADGYYSFGAPLTNSATNSTNAAQSENEFERRLRAFWPYMARGLSAERQQLSEQGAALMPSVAHWCYRRGAYAVTFGAPNRHEQIESRVALREWLGARTGAYLEEIERRI